MPVASRWMIRLSLVYLFIGFLIGALILIAKAYPAYSFVWILLPIHIEMLIFGFIIQFTMGTAYWILPRYLKGRSRGSTVWANIMVGMLNGGIFLNVLTYLSLFPQWGTLTGRLLEILGVILFVSLHWKRAVSHRS